MLNTDKGKQVTSVHPVRRVTKALPLFGDISPALRFAEESDYSIYIYIYYKILYGS